MKLNHMELAIKLLEIKGASFVSLNTNTAQTTLNKGRGASSMEATLGINPDDIRKLTKLVGLVGMGVTYETMVNNRLVKEGTPRVDADFEAGSLPWGEWVAGGEKMLLKHKGNFYLRVYCVSANAPKVEHIHKGVTIDLKDPKFDAFRKPEKAEGENQGLEKPIVVRSYGFDSIREITLDGEIFEIVAE